MGGKEQSQTVRRVMRLGEWKLMDNLRLRQGERIFIRRDAFS